MKEKPILFSSWKMGRVLAMPGEGITEMATLRPMKPQPVQCYAEQLPIFPASRYRVGDILWPREPLERHWLLNEAVYVADDSPVMLEGSVVVARWRWPKRDKLPAMFMPFDMARPNRYEVLKVEARRPQELTEAEMRQEGIETGNLGPRCAASLLRVKWMNKWSETYSRISWELNPCCWRITFSEVRQELP